MFYNIAVIIDIKLFEWSYNWHEIVQVSATEFFIFHKHLTLETRFGETVMPQFRRRVQERGVWTGSMLFANRNFMQNALNMKTPIKKP